VALAKTPAGVVIEIGPVTMFAGTTALIKVLFVTTKLVAAVPLKRTAVAPTKFRPVMLMLFPGALFVGEKLATVAGR
jgi:hypothetical protein